MISEIIRLKYIIPFCSALRDRPISVSAYFISDFVYIDLGWYFAKDLPGVREKQLVGFCKVPLQTEPTGVFALIDEAVRIPHFILCPGGPFHQIQNNHRNFPLLLIRYFFYKSLNALIGLFCF
jgi:hypothetical protein